MPGGKPSKWLAMHTDYVRSRFTSKAEERADKWYYPDAALPKTRGPAGYPIKHWFQEVKNKDGWKGSITLQIFANHVQKLAPMWAASPLNPDNVFAAPKDEGEATDAEATGAVLAEDAVEEEDEEEEPEVEVVETSASNTLSLAYLQCSYDASDDYSGAPTTKGHVVIQAVSGWTHAEEKDRGDFIVLSDGGDALCLTFTANSMLFDTNMPRRILAEKGLFGGIYADSPGAQHPAVTSMQKSIFTALGRAGDEIPSYKMTIPLKSRFQSISSVTGLHRVLSRNGCTEYTPVVDIGPQVLYYKQANTHPLALVHIELVGNRSKSTKLVASSIPKDFSSPNGNSGNARGGSTRRSMSPRTSTSTSNPSANGHQPPPHDNTTTGTSRSTAGPTAGVGDPFNLGSLRAMLPDIAERVVRVEEKVGAHDVTLNHVQLRLNNVENEILIIKSKLTEFNSRIAEFSESVDSFKEDLSFSATRAQSIQNRMSVLNITNNNLVSLFDSLKKSMIDIVKKHDQQEEARGALIKSANEVQVLLSNQINALDQKLQIHIEDEYANRKKVEESFAGFKVTMDSLEQTIGTDFPFDRNSFASIDERNIYDLLSKLEENQLKPLRNDVNESMKKTQDMYTFCVDMLAQGKILFPHSTETLATVTPVKPKVH